MSEDWKDDPELFDRSTGREIAASGLPAPTPEEALHELKIMSQMLEDHGCATTRDLIAAASVVVDAAHKDAHTPTSPKLQTEIVKFATAIFDPMQAAMTDEVEKLIGWEDKAKFYARMTSIFFQLARITGAATLRTVNANRDVVEVEATPVTTSASPEAALKKLLDMPIKSKYKH